MTRPLDSIAGRVLVASLLLLPLFLGVSGLYLERSHRLSIEAAQAERLQLQILTLLAQAEYDRELELPAALIEPRLSRPQSGLYARILDARGRELWQSPSRQLTGIAAGDEAPRELTPGERRFRRDGPLFHLAYQVLWETADGREVPLLFEVTESTEAVDADLRLYRRHLLAWLSGAAAMLVLCQLAILAWGLRPLRHLARDIAAVERGETEGLGGPYPREVQALTDNLNALLNSEQQRRDRVRGTLADLAHSLKTPLAVIASADSQAEDYPRLVREQAGRMEEIVSYQLQRAVGGRHKLLRPVDIHAVVARLRRGLVKVYADRDLDITCRVADGAHFRGDERDLLEMLGNLMDNACKHCRARVEVRAKRDDQGLRIQVHDDGDGVAPALRRQVLQRGARADTRAPGQGIGLAVVHDIAASYGGDMAIEDSPLGGACVALHFPR
ncbi:ATP-binding protein [Parahaliea mediterranea]|uniref:histidine kinase n=1 Tax=Parahaliea mediterranea TaxID=651086 RepID=A0A939DI16_9GAMM|nr:ATP-binding protein [Parahaliea mediterranea]MBN7797847.1 GHKL domain-containing protein [Parahaliea mediterranea]